VDIEREYGGASWPTRGLSYGGDWSPEQWSPGQWLEDVALMREAGVNMVTLGVFSWGLLETRPGEYAWEWFDDVLALVHENGISVDLATPTAAPPSWLLHAHPEILPVDEDLHPQHPGGRLGWCPSSPVFRDYALSFVEQLAQRYGSHPAVRLWHLGNEYGGGNARCYCDVSAARFREWLRTKYGSVAAVNEAWGTAFWGHTFSSFDEIVPARGPRDAVNPARFLDYHRFSSDELLAHFDAEAAIVRAHASQPITTNFMVGSGGHVVDYSTWSGHVDIVSNDHYTLVADPDRSTELALAADRMRGLTRDRSPWLLMEHSTGAPSWQERNRAKSPGEIVRNALAHVARGSDGAMFFQWRASTAGTEQFHSAMVPHAGTNTRVWREIVALGDALARLAEVQGAPVERAQVAMLMDEESAWVFEQGLKPHRALRYAREPRAWHAALWERNVLTDVLPADADLAGYELVVVPSLILIDAARAARIHDYVRDGGTVLVTYLSGIVDENSRVLAGGYPGALRDMLGVWTEEFRPLQRDESVLLDDGSVVQEWTEDTVLDGAETVLSYATGDSAGRAAVTRHRYGGGTAWYVSAQLPAEAIRRVISRIVEEIDIRASAETPAGLEAVRRVGSDAEYLFLINHTAIDIPVSASGHELIEGSDIAETLVVPAGAVRVVREARR
jgi:beta-galactosidase